MKVGKILGEKEINGKVSIVRYPSFTDLNKNCSYTKLLEILKPHQFSPIEENIFNNPKNVNNEVDVLSNIIENNEKERHLFLILENNIEIIGGARLMYRYPNHKIRKHIGYFNMAIKKDLNNNFKFHKFLTKHLFKKGKENFNFNTILSGLSSKNKKNIKLYSEIGFEEKGKIENGIKKNGNYYDYIIMQKDFNQN